MSNTETVVNSKASRFAALRAKVLQDNTKGFSNNNDSEQYWKVDTDKVGTGSAVLRFLYAKTGEAYPYIKLYTHGFQGPTGKWYIENCPTSINEECPVCKANSILWDTNDEALRKIVSSRKRKLGYISNILVINDPKHSENNGKVFLYRYGKKIFDKLTGLINPEFEDLEPIDPFDPREGANFKLRVVKIDGFSNYDKSSFDGASAIGNEDVIAKIEAQLISIENVLEPKNFKSFSELEKQFKRVIPEGADSAEKPALEDPDGLVSRPRPTSKAAPPAGVATPKPLTTTTQPSSDSSEEIDDDMLARLAAEV